MVLDPRSGKDLVVAPASVLLGFVGWASLALWPLSGGLRMDPWGVGIDPWGVMMAT